MDLPKQPRPTAALIEWAGWCADIGRATGAFKVFPCWPGEKHPRYKGWQDAASWDRKTATTPWLDNPRFNIGLAIQAGFVGVDGDLYKAGNDAKLKDFEDRYGAMPPTLEFVSARGGFHMIYKSSKTFGNGKGTLPDFGDVRGHGGLLVGPGSVFEGRRYTVEAAEMPVALPPVIEGMLREKRETSQASRELPQFTLLNDPKNLEAFTHWLKNTAKPSIEGQGGNNILAATGAMGSSYALSDDVTLALMIEHWNPRCLPEWTEEEIEKYGGSGYRSATSDFGNKALTNEKLMFEPNPGEAGWGPTMLTSASIAGKPAPARQWAAGDDTDGWLPLGELTTLYGPDGSGKTTLVGQWAIAQARGERVFGVIKTRKMPVLLIACEDDEHELHRRFEKQGIERTDDIRFASFVGLDTAMHPAFRRGEALAAGEDTVFYRYLDYHLTSLGAGEKLLILDNLGQIYQGDYMDIPQVRAFLNTYCRRLLKKHNATGILLAHPSDNQKVSGDGGFGSVAWSAGVRSRLYFDWVRTAGKAVGDTRVLARKKSSYGRKHQDHEGLFLEWVNYQFVPTEPPAVEDKPKRQAKADAPADDTPSQRRVKLSIVTLELTAMFKANPSRVWESDRDVARALAGRLAKAGHEGFGEDTLRLNYLKAVREGAYELYTDGVWGVRAALAAATDPTVVH